MAPGDVIASDGTMLPSGEAAELIVPPARFGVARLEHVGNALHGLIYEHEYTPEPVRKYSEVKPPDVECTGVLLPAVRSGRAPFRFFGLRVPASADHARCWLGAVLIQEIRLGRLQHVELAVPSEAEAPAQQPAGPLQTHGPQPTWRWMVWVAGASLSYELRDPHVEVTMHISPVDGIFIDLQCENDGDRCFIYRVLRQYCDSNSSGWHPIPEHQTSISKIHDREISAENRHSRLIGQPVPQTGNESLMRMVVDLREAETWLVQALSRLEAAREVASLKDMMIYMDELRKALKNAHDVRFKLKPNYNHLACEALETLLQVALKTGEDREQLAEIRDLAIEIHGYGVKEPENLREVINMLEF
mmetsp:Transcript_123899/g.361847  ORF Transcript_123899/g.361847 Transcript_123899/m.361847 type:complete len:361 (+) Transcript_123899:49-1131(+)